MKKKLLLVFIIIILMPITVISVMVFTTYRDSEKRELDNLRETATEILQINDRLMQNTIRLVEKDLDRIILESSLSSEENRQNTSREKLVRQAFIIDEKDSFIFPPENEPKSAREMEFINEAENIELISSLRARINSSENITNVPQWFTWFMGDGINFIYFTQTGSVIKGFLVERYALVSELINVLPQAGEADGNFKIQLSDARGNLLYQWGNYNFENSIEAIWEYSLSDPLGSWRFFYYLDLTDIELKIINNQNVLLFSGLIIMTFIILLLSVYFYRENTKEMNIARQQVSFVNQVSHELKTPLTNIRLYSEMLENKITDKKQLNFLKVIINESSRLGRMINNVLTFSKGERGELKKSINSTDINGLISQVLDKFQPLLKESQMEVHFEDTILPRVKTDGDMIEQILVNLVANAIKYASSGKYLGIDTEHRDEQIIIRIIDKGPGITDSERVKIFKPFYRIDNSLSQQNSGTGIGLSIAEKLAEETGSELNLEKSSNGAVFTLTIPIQRG